MKTAPFDLGLAEAGHPLVTRAGKRVASFGMTAHESYPICVLVPNSGGFGNGCYNLRIDGRCHPTNDSKFDLFLLIEDDEPAKEDPGKPSPLQSQVGGDHYRKLAIQPVEFCQRNQLGYCESAVIKYVTRHREKNGVQDIDKAIHYLQLLKEIEYPEAAK
jgi:hypothetical protein